MAHPYDPHFEAELRKHEQNTRSVQELERRELERYGEAREGGVADALRAEGAATEREKIRLGLLSGTGWLESSRWRPLAPSAGGGARRVRRHPGEAVSDEPDRHATGCRRDGGCLPTCSCWCHAEARGCKNCGRPLFASEAALCAFCAPKVSP